MAEVLRARGKLGPYGPPPAPELDDDVPVVVGDVDRAAVREWAATIGVEVASRGPIPAAVLEQYRNQTPGAAT